MWKVATKVIENYNNRGELRDISDPDALHEARLLMLDISKAKFLLGWEPRMNINQCVALTIDWNKGYKQNSIYELCLNEISTFLV